MPTPPSRQPANVASSTQFVPSHGPMIARTLPESPALPPLTQTSYNAAADTVSFDVAPYASQTVTFPNLPNRTNANPLNALTSQQGQIRVAPFNLLHFSVALQNVSGGTPTVTPQAIDAKLVRIPGPFLGPNVYTVFQATITAGAQGAKGSVVGTLTLMVN